MYMETAVKMMFSFVVWADPYMYEVQQKLFDKKKSKKKRESKQVLYFQLIH